MRRLSEHAEYVDELLCDRKLRCLDDYESRPMFEAYRDAIADAATNDLAVALLFLKLGNVQRDIAEGLDYALDRAIDTHRRAVGLFTRSMGMRHQTTLKSRHALALTLVARRDNEAARAELQAIFDLIVRDFPNDEALAEAAAVKIQGNPDSVREAAVIVAKKLGLPNPRDDQRGYLL